ncbi:MAG: RNA polymerase sigma factor [Myxococcota bacterium]
MADDFMLLQRWKTGDRAAGNQLMSRHYDSIHRFFEIKVPRAAEDLSQRCFLAAIEGLDRLREGGSVRAYLFGIARHLLIHYLRDSGRHERVIGFGEADRADSGPTPSRVVASQQEQRLLLRALDELRDDQRIALQLFYWEGLSNREIGEVLEIPTSTVTSRIARSREHLRHIVAELPATSSRVRATVEADLEGWTRSLIAHPTARWTPPGTRH